MIGFGNTMDASHNVENSYMTTQFQKSLIETIESSLDGHTSRWCQLIKYEMKNMENICKSIHYSAGIVRITGIRQKFELKKYRNGGRTHRCRIPCGACHHTQDMMPELTKDEIVTLMTDHFEQIVQDVFCIPNITIGQDWKTSWQDIMEQNHPHTTGTAPITAINL